MRSTLFVLTGVLLLSACSTPPPPAPPPTSSKPFPPKLATAAELVTKVKEGIQARKSARIGTTLHVTNDKGTQTQQVNGVLRAEPDGRVSAQAQSEQATVLEVPEGLFMQRRDAEVWVKIEAVTKEDNAKALLTLLGARRIFQLSDPTHRYEEVLLGGKIEAAVEEKSDNVPTVKYTIDVDLVQAAAKANDFLTKATLMALTQKLGRTSAKHEVWLNIHNVPERWQLTEFGGDGKGEVVDARYYGWGGTYELDAPSAEDSGR